KFLYEIKRKNNKSQMFYFGYHEEKIITSTEWLDRARERRLFYFWFAWQGMINFTFLKNIKLKFIDGIFAEDCHFGVLLFALSKNIYIFPRQIYIYRIRESSLMNFTCKKWVVHPDSHLKKIDIFESSNEARLYHEAASWMRIALEFIKFIHSGHHLNDKVKQHFLPVVCNKALTLQNFDKDPLHLKKYSKNLKIHIQNQPLGAVSRVKEYLSYKIAKEISRKKSIMKLTLAFSVVKISVQHQKEVRRYKRDIKRDALNKRLPLEFYRDYQKAIKLKNFF
ncbi:TPA: glycosyltransferase family 2 protein, partial [Campylobacter coli]|nr:glycosyltransferase family 2 protein [Campylobacter coli]HEB9346804.1 glycosyltransferase family 2 protein [Campylobacter coli]HEC1736983.1 glycosyltransferase family 2 protein [Campylobacter coli]HEF1919765.1 glycosyltransferase family 2 protein [Campylobacter coli]